MSKNEARGNYQRQSEAIRGNQLLVIQRPSETISDAIPGRTSGAMKVQSDAIIRNHTQSDAISTPGALCFRVFRVLGGPQVGLCFVFLCYLSRHTTGNGPVFCVFVFWQTPLKTQHGGKRHTRRSDGKVGLSC